MNDREIIKQLAELGTLMATLGDLKKAQTIRSALALLNKGAAQTRNETIREFSEELKKHYPHTESVRRTIDRVGEQLTVHCVTCEHFIGCEPSTIGVCKDYHERKNE